MEASDRRRRVGAMDRVELNTRTSRDRASSRWTPPRARLDVGLSITVAAGPLPASCDAAMIADQKGRLQPGARAR
jgi:hypothetical protein